MRYIKVVFALFVFSVATITSSAQETETTSSLPDIGSYSILVLNSEIGDNIYFFTQGRLHHYDLFNNSKQFLIRSAIEYKFTNRFKIHIGFASVDKQPFDKTAIEDFEIQRWFYDEFQYTFGNPEKIQLKARFRHERRWISPNDQIDTYQSDRLRLKLEFVKNLGSLFYAKLFSEAFYITENKKISKFRNNISFGTKLSKELKFEAGLIDEGLLVNKSTFIVSRLYINTSWRSQKQKSTVEKEEKPKEILFDNNNKLNNVISDSPIENIVQNKIDLIEPKSPKEELVVINPIEDQIQEKVKVVDSLAHQEFKYHVIVAAHKDKPSTSKTLDRLKRDGYLNGKVIEVPENVYYRVSAAELTSKEEAEKVLHNLSSLGYLKPWIFSTAISEAEKKTEESYEITTPSDSNSYQYQYHIIISSNRILGEAQATVNKLKTSGHYNASILPQVYNGYYRISAANYKEDSTARIALNEIKNEFASAWLFKTPLTNIQSVDEINLEPEIKKEEDTIYERSSKSIPYRPVHHVITASTKNLKLANDILQNLRKQGFVNAYILENKANGAYRISAAHFKKHSDTTQSIDLLSQKGYQGAWVLTIN